VTTRPKRIFTAEHREKLAAANRGKIPSAETLAKRSTALKGRVFTAAHKSLISAALTGKPKSSEARARMSAAKAGKPGRRLSDAERMALSLAHSGKILSVEHRAKLSAAKFGKEPQWRKTKIEYAGARFRSTWEVRVARALDALGVRWQYEPERFNLGPLTYRPDFFLPDDCAYWEVKGYWAPRSKLAVGLFRSQRVEPLVLINKAAMVMLEQAVINTACEGS
jgi:hypothetical protein